MSIHVDPTLLAGFAAEARSHLPEIRESLERFRSGSDDEALGAVRVRLEGMRDASAMVGLDPLGRAIDAVLGELKAGEPLEEPLAALEDYLGRLETGEETDPDPADLLDELGKASPPPEPESAASKSAAEAPSEPKRPADAAEPSLLPASLDFLPRPSWASSPDEEPLPPPRPRETAPPPRPFAAQAAPKKATPTGASAEVREIFAAEADEHAQVVSRHLSSLQPNLFQREALDGLRRRVHNLKGSAALVGLEDLSRVAHGMEDLLDRLHDERRGPSAGELSSLETAGDALQALIYRNGEGVDTDQVLATLASPPVVTAKPPEPQEEASTATAAPPSTETPLPQAAPAAEEPSPTPAPAPARAEVEDRPGDDRSRFVRVPVEALDEAVRLLVEVEAERQHLRSLLAEMREHTGELDLTDRRLQREVRAIETELEVAALGEGPAPTRSAADTPFDALEMDRYTELHERSRALVESTVDLGTVKTEVDRRRTAMDQSVDRLAGVTLSLRDRLLGLRLVPLAGLGPRLEGVVRQAARALGKEARLRLVDPGIELDKDVLDALVDPLGHLLRNAVAHGLESAEARRAAGKDEVATIVLEAAYTLQGVRLRVRDDGAGIDLDAVGRRAVQRGLKTPDELEAMSPEAIRELIFEPGLSTAATVDRISGRGVGMDVVRRRLSELQGRLEVSSEPGEGTTVSLELPTSLAVQRVLLVRDGGHRLAVPTTGLERLERVGPDSLQAVGDREVLRSGDTVYPVLHLARAVGLPQAGSPRSAGDGRVAILMRADDRPVAFLVREILESREVVVQDLGRHLRRLPGILGVTHLGSDHPVPILDPTAWIDGKPSAPDREVPAPAPRAPARPAVLVVDDSLSMRRYLSQVVDRFGFDAVEARDGLDALDLLEEGAIVPSLVLLDLEMPRMDGFELLEALESDRRFRAVPKVVLSSRGADKHRNRAVDQGAAAYLVKPVAENRLEATLRSLVPGAVR